MDLGQALTEKIEQVVAAWVKAVHRDTEIESAKKLAYQAVRNSLPEVLEQMALLLSQHQESDIEKLEDNSLNHGFVRAQQGYDTTEIVREYRLLRQVVLMALEPELLSGSAKEVLRAIKTIDFLLDEVITASLESYIEARLNELRQVHTQLDLTNQELMRLVQTQKDNLSFMAHELKTPLNSIIGHSSILLQKQRNQLNLNDKTTSLEQLERVLSNGRRLLQIINDTLEISRYEEGQIRLKLESVNIVQLIKNLIGDGLESLATEKNLQLDIDTAQAPTTVITDPLRLQQVITNLLSNAIRYTPEGNIQVVCRQVDDLWWQLTVADTGIGITEVDQEKIFEPYTQASSQVQNQYSTGLGLAIVQRITQLMGGTIELTSTPGEGSTFTVTMPINLDTEECDADL